MLDILPGEGLANSTATADLKHVCRFRFHLYIVFSYSHISVTQVCCALGGNGKYHWLNSLSLLLSSGKPAIPVSFGSDQNVVCMYNPIAHKACKHCSAFWEWCSELRSTYIGRLGDNDIYILLGSVSF